MLVGKEGLGEAVPAGLFHEVVEHPPACIPVPCGYDVPQHLVHARVLEEGERHRVLSVDMPHEAVADGHVDLGVG